MRALFAGTAEKFEQHTAAWPPDVREHARKLAAGVFGSGEPIAVPVSGE